LANGSIYFTFIDGFEITYFTVSRLIKLGEFKGMKERIEFSELDKQADCPGPVLVPVRAEWLDPE
jgi:hypothetical protein